RAQGAAGLVLHHPVRGRVGAEELQHEHHIGMVEASERAALLDEALESVIEGRQVLLLDRRQDRPFTAQGQRVGQILLDRDRVVFRIVGQIYDGKPAERNLSLDAVQVELEARWQWMIYLRDSHGRDLGGLQNRSERMKSKARSAQNRMYLRTRGFRTPLRLRSPGSHTSAQ